MEFDVQGRGYSGAVEGGVEAEVRLWGGIGKRLGRVYPCCKMTKQTFFTLVDPHQVFNPNNDTAKQLASLKQ